MKGINITRRFSVTYYLLTIIGFLFITDLSVFLDILILRQVSVFLCLTILPGFLLVRLLHLSKLNFVTKYLFSIGLSIAVITFGGLLINLILPHIGMLKPLSLTPLLITVNALILILCGLCYKFDREPIFININIGEALPPPALLLLLLPLMTFLGAYLVRGYNNNTILLLMLALVAFIIALIAFDKFIPQRLYPLAIYMISMALLLQLPLVVRNLAGADILAEYYSQQLAQISSYWNPTATAGISNTMPIGTIWPTIYSSIMNINGTWLFKIGFPLMFSLVPLGLYCIYSSQIGKKRAFLAISFYMSFAYFFMGRLGLAKEQMGQLFVVLILVSVFTVGIRRGNHKALLMIIFGTMLIISHYATAYIFMFLIIFVYALLFFIPRDNEKLITGTWICLFLIMGLSWYMYIANAVTFTSGVTLLDRIATSIKTEMFLFEARAGSALTLIGYQPLVVQTIGHQVYAWLFRVIQFLFIVGGIRLIWDLVSRRKQLEVRAELFAFVFAGLALLVLCLMLPGMNRSFNMARTYALALLFIVPMGIFGIETLFKGLSKILRFNLSEKTVLLVFTLLILIPNLLFCSGFIYEVTGDFPGFNITLGKKSMENSDDVQLKSNYYFRILSDADISGMRWLSSVMDKEKVYADAEYLHPVMGYGMIPPVGARLFVLRDSNMVIEDSYVYLGSGNIKGNMWTPATWTERGAAGILEFKELEPLLRNGNKIYSNGSSEIYRF